MRHANCATARLTPAATPTSRKRRKSLSRMPPRPALRAAVTPNTRCCPHGELKLHAETRQALDALDMIRSFMVIMLRPGARVVRVPRITVSISAGPGEA
ncbi:hypothetical protein AV530_004473 [Patagioenas fasciata monilis]|uniref:Uncharacterized protein n=1 Tax=Patagioenas fasciata monilis TaxID=372326 RepID=A0A1V4JCN2_PATFA|nr:hypothetical protein AV530_004473 [Patagioenas fasciata monilis]